MTSPVLRQLRTWADLIERGLEIHPRVRARIQAAIAEQEAQAQMDAYLPLAQAAIQAYLERPNDDPALYELLVADAIRAFMDGIGWTPPASTAEEPQPNSWVEPRTWGHAIHVPIGVWFRYALEGTAVSWLHATDGFWAWDSRLTDGGQAVAHSAEHVDGLYPELAAYGYLEVASPVRVEVESPVQEARPQTAVLDLEALRAEVGG